MDWLGNSGPLAPMRWIGTLPASSLMPISMDMGQYLSKIIRGPSESMQTHPHDVMTCPRMLGVLELLGIAQRFSEFFLLGYVPFRAQFCTCGHVGHILELGSVLELCGQFVKKMILFAGWVSEAF